MSITDIYDRAGLPIDIDEWGRLREIEDYHRVGSTDVGEYWVSTVWLGLDHNFSRHGPPIIFETMVFLKSQRDDPDDRGLADIDVVRYATEQEALAGHQAMVLLVQATTVQEPPLGPSEAENGRSTPESGV